MQKDKLDSFPVPKVTSATFGALLSSVIMTLFLRYGWTSQQAETITPAVIDAVMILTPPIAAFVFGYFQRDGDRARLIDERDDARARAMIADNRLGNYLAQFEEK